MAWQKITRAFGGETKTRPSWNRWRLDSHGKPTNRDPGVHLCKCGCRQECHNFYRPGHRLRRTGVLFAYEDRGYDTPCWVWQQKKDSHGYGRVSLPGRRSTGAHRYMYEMVNGPIADNLHLDHLCQTPSCVRPDHLEPVKPSLNIQRGMRRSLMPEDIEKIGALLRSGISAKDIAQMWNKKGISNDLAKD